LQERFGGDASLVGRRSGRPSPESPWAARATAPERRPM
jgi:hypothetical protein